MNLKLLVAVLLLGVSLAGLANSQSTDAVVSGIVTDPSGAAIANATVTARNTKTGVNTTAKTNAAGVYLFAALLPGAYQLVGEHEGFQKYVYEDLQLDVGSQFTINLSLTLGKTADSVVVQAATEQLETSTSTVGAVITSRKLEDLPLVGRNAYDLITTQAGTSPSGQNFNGARAGALNITVDGVQARDNYLDQLVFSARAATISVDRIAEFRIVTSPADAEYGRGAGQIQSISRSGTNRFHGSLFEEHRDTDLTANTWFNNQLGTDPKTGQAIAPRNFLVRNQFGGRAGGPIHKNKTVFHIN
jgi:Carboxypeptidase regulatory-like domain